MISLFISETSFFNWIGRLIESKNKLKYYLFGVETIFFVFKSMKKE